MQFMSDWSKNTTQAGQLKERPNVPAVLYDNITVRGSWIAAKDMEVLYRRYGRIVNDITLAFPHSGIVAAAQEPGNGIIQRQDLSV